MVRNALAALTAANALGIDGAAAIAGFRPGAGRGLQRALPGGIRCWTRATTRTARPCARRWPCWRTMPGRRVAVLGDMLELGAMARRSMPPWRRRWRLAPTWCSPAAR